MDSYYNRVVGDYTKVECEHLCKRIIKQAVRRERSHWCQEGLYGLLGYNAIESDQPVVAKSTADGH